MSITDRFLRGVIPNPGAAQPGEGSPVDTRMRLEIPSPFRSGQAPWRFGACV